MDQYILGNFTTAVNYTVPTSFKIITLSFISIGCLLGMLGNLGLIILVLKVPKLRIPFNYLVAYMCFLDLLHLSFKGGIYFKKIWLGNKGLSPVECLTLTSSGFFANLGIPVQITAISVFRLLKVTASSVLNEKAFVGCAIGLSVALSTTAAVYSALQPDSSYSSCISTVSFLAAGKHPSPYRYIYGPLFLIVLVTVIASYVRIVCFTRKHRKRIAASINRKTTDKVDVATTNSLLMITINLVAAYVPLIVFGSMDLTHVHQLPDKYWILNVRTLCVTFNLYSSVVNPFVYFYGNRVWTQIVKEQWSQFVSRSQSVTKFKLGKLLPTSWT